jgi:hypothetical protein
MKQTAVEWLVSQISYLTSYGTIITHHKDITELVEQAQEMEKYNAKVEAKKYYLKGFEDAELTESQNCTHEQTMRDAESFFELIYPLKSE